MKDYNKVKTELQCSLLKIEDDLHFYDEKIKEFIQKKEKEELRRIIEIEKLDQYVIDHYDSDKLAAWRHFVFSEKTDKSFTFFNRFFKNTGLLLSKTSGRKVQFLINAKEISNLKKAAKTIRALFKIVYDENPNEKDKDDSVIFKIGVINVNRQSNMYITMKDDSFILKNENAKRATFKETEPVILLSKLIDFSKK